MALGELIGTTPIWWEIQNIPDQLVEELRRRSNTNNLGFNYPKSVNFDFEKNSDKYKGPMTPWVRVFSNSTGKPTNILTPPSEFLLRKNDSKFQGYDGFILKGGDGFNDVFGYDEKTGLKDKNAIIGYQANNIPHYLNAQKTQLSYSTKIDPNFPQNNQVPRILPTPGIVSVNVKQNKDFITYASFKFRCFSLAQLEYLTPFFLNPGINVFIEFGWNLFNQKSLLSLKEEDCWRIVSAPQTALDNALLSNGNYGCVTGIITKYNFDTKDGFIYDCNVELISRQGLYAGLRTDTVVTTNKTFKTIVDDTNTTTYINLKNFVKRFIPKINDVIRIRENFYSYISSIQILEDKPDTEEAKAVKEQLDTRAAENILSRLPNSIPPNSGTSLKKSKFYGGKIENRIFTGRRFDVYGKSKSPEDDKNSAGPIEYNYKTIGGTIDIDGKNPQGKKTQISFADKNDFDAEDNNDQVWLQLDFVFEVFNLFMTNNVTYNYKIDIDEIVINAHPNLISLNKDLLIPNPISPKINIGKESVDGKTSPGGYLYGDAADRTKNKFLNLKADHIFKSGVSNNQSTNTNTDLLVINPSFVGETPTGLLAPFQTTTSDTTSDTSMDKANAVVVNTFKTKEAARDDLDTIINYLYYNNGSTNNRPGSAAFPQTIPLLIKNDKTTTTYEPCYYGFLKNLLISKKKLIDLVTEDTKDNNYKSLLKNLLDFINESVDFFWKLDVVDRPDGKGLAIIDKNLTANFDKIYTFELGSTNNVIKSINFDVSLSNEQSVNVYFGGVNLNLLDKDANLTQKYRRLLSNADNLQSDELKYIISRLTNEPFLKFNDRMDIFELKKFLQEKSNSLNQTVFPGTPEGMNKTNPDISYLQTDGKKEDVLMMQVKQPQSSNDNKDDENLNVKYLNWPESMRGNLRAVLTDGDIEKNSAKYSGVADNFTITIVFDGIYGFRNLQCFAINNLPKPYVPGNVIFQVLDVEHQIESGKWTTTVTALVRSVGGKNYKYVTV